MATRACRILLVVASIVIVLVVAAPAALWLLFDEQDLRARASQYIRQQTGRELTLRGPIRLSFFPWLGAELRDVSVAQPAAAGGDPFARFAEVGLRVRLLPLIRGAIEVGGVRGAGGRISLAGYQLRDLAVSTGAFGGGEATDVSLRFTLVPDDAPGVPVALDGRMVFHVAEQRLDLSDLKGTAGGMSFTGRVRAQRVLDAPVFDGQLETGTFNLRALLSQLGIAYAPADAKAMTAVSLAAGVASSPARTELRGLVASLDGSTLKGAATMTAGATPSWDAALAVDSLDVDRYLPAAAAASAGSSPADPYASLRELVARVELSAQRLRAFGLQFSGVSAVATARDGVISVAPIRGALYGGRGELAARVDVRGKEAAAYHLDGTFTNVSVQPLLADARSISALSGTGDLSLSLEAEAADPSRLMDALGGQVTMSVRDGRIEGADLLKFLAQARAMADTLRGKPAAVQPDPADRTKFTRLTGSTTIVRGVARSRDLKLEAPDLAATGEGTIDLVRERIDYLLRARSDQAGNVAVPIAIEGPFDAPAYRIQAGAAVRDAAKQELKKQLEKRGLKGLLKIP